MNLRPIFAIALGALATGSRLAAQSKPAGEGEVATISGQTEGSYRVFAYAESPVYRFPYRIEIDMADGRTWRALPRFQNQHTDFDEPFEKAPVEMTVAGGGRLLVFSPFTGRPGEVIEVTYLAPLATPAYLYLVNRHSSAPLSGERWYTLYVRTAADVPYTLHVKPGAHAIAGQLLDASSAVVADLTGAFHGSTLIGTITPRTGLNHPQGRFRWAFLERGHELDGDWWSGEEHLYVTGEKVRKP